EKIKAAEAEITELENTNTETGDRVALNDKHDKLKEAVANGNAQIAQHKAVEQYNKRVAAVADMEAEFNKAKEFAGRLTDQVEKLAGEIKYRIMSEVEMPVEGLKYVD